MAGDGLAKVRSFGRFTDNADQAGADVHAQSMQRRLRGLPWLEPNAADWLRAREVYRILGSQPGMMQRSVKHADLLIAAAAERAGLTLVHYDADYETIAEITGQPVRWVAPRGSV